MAQVVGNHDRCGVCGLVHWRYDADRRNRISMGNDTYISGAGAAGSEHRLGLEPFEAVWNTTDRRDGGRACYVVGA